MPSPFPGMDPYLEMFEWGDFHPRFLLTVCDEIAEQLPAGYMARVERRSYLELDVEYHSWEPPDSAPQIVIPDIAIMQDTSGTELTQQGSVATEDWVEPIQQQLPQHIEHRETYLEIRDTQSRTVITALELLSPTNKRAGTVGSRLYTKKRLAVLESQSHFVELDLLRRGQRVLLAEPGLPPDHDYYAFVSRAEDRPKIDLYSWRLRDRMPGIRIPLKPEHGHVPLDLQRALNLAYSRARYENTLDYRQPLAPPPRPADDAWLQSVLQSAAPTS